MTERLTTGQMIDQLKPGEKAKVVEDSYGRLVGDIIVNTGNQLKWDGIDIVFNIHDATWGLKWEIIKEPKYTYVSFVEAMEALNKGKTVTYRGNYNYDMIPATFKCRLVNLSIADNSLHELYNGKWTIEEVNNERFSVTGSK